MMKSLEGRFENPTNDDVPSIIEAIVAYMDEHPEIPAEARTFVMEKLSLVTSVTGLSMVMGNLAKYYSGEGDFFDIMMMEMFLRFAENDQPPSEDKLPEILQFVYQFIRDNAPPTVTDEQFAMIEQRIQEVNSLEDFMPFIEDLREAIGMHGKDEHGGDKMQNMIERMW
jgi:hypothetical protein